MLSNNSKVSPLLKPPASSKEDPALNESDEFDGAPTGGESCGSKEEQKEEAKEEDEYGGEDMYYGRRHYEQ